jgi:hypothetical protein
MPGSARDGDAGQGFETAVRDGGARRRRSTAALDDDAPDRLVKNAA